MSLQAIIQLRRGRLEQAGILPKIATAPHSQTVLAMRPSLTLVKLSLLENPERFRIVDQSPLLTLFDYTLPLLEGLLTGLDEAVAEKIMDLLCNHGIETAQRYGIKKAKIELDSLYSDLDKYQAEISAGRLEEIIEIYDAYFNRSEKVVEYIMLKLGDDRKMVDTIQAENDGKIRIKFNSKVGDAHLVAIITAIQKEKKTITHLDLSKCNDITDYGIFFLSEMAALQSLSLQECEQITDAGIIALAKMSTLLSLNLRLCNIHDIGIIEGVSKLTNLLSLNLEYCNRLTDVGMASLPNLQTLQSLFLRRSQSFDSGRITDVGIAHISRLASLTSLGLQQCKAITDVGLAHLSGLIVLQSLDLEDCTKITDDGLAHISSLSKLESLNIAQCYKITDNGLAHISKLSKLKSLNLAFCRQITDKGLAHLSKLSAAQLLSLMKYYRAMGTKLRSGTISSQINGITSLLRVTKVAVTALLTNPTTLTELQRLNLEKCDKITDEGLAHLSSLPALLFINVQQCGQLTEFGLAALHKIRPNLEIIK